MADAAGLGKYENMGTLNLHRPKKGFVRLLEFPDATEGPDPSSVGSTSRDHRCRTDAPAAEDELH